MLIFTLAGTISSVTPGWRALDSEAHAVTDQSVMSASAATVPTDVFIEGSSGTSVSVGSDNRVEIPAVPSGWSNADQARYRRLVNSEALQQITVAEKQELDNLQRRRRQFHHPRSAEEIAWTYKQNLVTQQLIESLERYVQFHCAPRDPGTPAKEKNQAR